MKTVSSSLDLCKLLKSGIFLASFEKKLNFQLNLTPPLKVSLQLMVIFPALTFLLTIRVVALFQLCLIFKGPMGKKQNAVNDFVKTDLDNFVGNIFIPPQVLEKNEKKP